MNKIYFKYTTDPYGFLSNFSPHPVEIDDKYYLTTEHYYQACKVSDPIAHDIIRLKPTPKSAKVTAWTYPLREDWNDVKVDVMRKALTYKIEQHPFIVDKLLESGDAILIEDSKRDAYWGNGADGQGLNMLGKLWMELRVIILIRDY